jgi:hypothetical protein
LPRSKAFILILHLVPSSGYKADESDEEPGAGVQRIRASRSRQLLRLA